MLNGLRGTLFQNDGDQIADAVCGKCCAEYHYDELHGGEGIDDDQSAQKDRTMEESSMGTMPGCCSRTPM